LASAIVCKVAASIQADWEPGDRLPVTRVSGDRFVLPDAILNGELEFRTLVDLEGRPLPFKRDVTAGHVICKRRFATPADNLGPVWFEYRAPGEFALRAESPDALLQDEELATEQGVRIVLSGSEDGRLLCGALPLGAGLPEFGVALRAARLSTHAGFDQLMCLPLVREMELLDHQIRTAKTVLRRFRGRALLCDEVGLGKTIEAGLISAELQLRGLARSVLVLVPPSLIEQWQAELRRKFSLDFITHDDPAFRERGAAAWSEFDRVIVSTHTAKREPHRSAILERRWDLVIVDEAHHLRNRTTQLWKFTSEIRKQFMLLLTATPVQNNLDELFNLVTLLEPGLLSTAKQFQRRFVDRRDKLTPRNLDELHALLAEVMVRNRRSTVGLQFTRRWARTFSVALSEPEADLYRRVTAFVRQHLRTADQRAGLSRMALLSLQMALGSSSLAAAGTLETMAANPRVEPALRSHLQTLAAEARRPTTPSKLHRLLALLQDFPDKMVIFTQFRATQGLLAEHLAAAGHDVAVFHGGLSRMEKEAAIAAFRGPARLLLCTESGSEGRNLQFAHAVCNFDLPWNPMRIEQRIGRLSRIGQTHDVHVFNLVAADTVEAAVLQLLDAKLSMFELVIGEIDMILGNLDEEREFQEVVADLWATADSSDDFARRMEELGNRLVAAKQAYLTQRSHDDRLFGSRFAPDA
jgi:superfamily II DNA or RNA helicase